MLLIQVKNPNKKKKNRRRLKLTLIEVMQKDMSIEGNVKYDFGYNRMTEKKIFVVNPD